MNNVHNLYAFLCILVGGGISWAGYRIKAPYDRPPGTTGFAGPIFSPHLLIGCAGDLLVVVGLVIALLFSFIFFLT